MAIQMRRGAFENFDPASLLPGEWAVVLSGDTGSTNGQSVYVCFAAGSTKRLATVEDMATIIRNAETEVVGELTRLATNTDESLRLAESERVAAEQQRASSEQSRASAEAKRVDEENKRASAESVRESAEAARSTAESKRSEAESSRASAESKRDTAEGERSDAESSRASSESARAQAESGRASAESSRAAAESKRSGSEASRESAESKRVAAEGARAGAENKRVEAEKARADADAARETAQAKNNADQAQNNAAAKGLTYQIVADSGYKSNGSHNVPTATSGRTGVVYLTPNLNQESNNLYESWMWINGAWELMGEDKHVAPTTTDDVDSIVGGTSVTADRYLNSTGLSYLWTKLVAWATAKFAALKHTHSASDVTSGTLSADRLPTVPVTHGGTGATTAGEALSAIGAAAASHTHSAGEVTSGTLATDRIPVIPVSKGGTGASSAAAARSNLGAAASSHTHDAGSITSGTLPVSRGGTGASSAGAAFRNLSGYTLDLGTNNTSDTWIPVMANSTIQHRVLPTLPFPVSAGGTGATSIEAARRNLHISQGSKVCTGHGTPWVTLFNSWSEFQQATGCYDSGTPTLVTMNGDWSAFDGSLSGCELRGGEAVYVMAQTQNGIPNISSSQKLRISWICIW
jgi:hypothetical protein